MPAGRQPCPHAHLLAGWLGHHHQDGRPRQGRWRPQRGVSHQEPHQLHRHGWAPCLPCSCRTHCQFTTPAGCNGREGQRACMFATCAAPAGDWPLPLAMAKAVLEVSSKPHHAAGEHMDEFESFDTKSFVGRLLGKGDWGGFMDRIKVGWGCCWTWWRFCRGLYVRLATAPRGHAHQPWSRPTAAVAKLDSDQGKAGHQSDLLGLTPLRQHADQIWLRGAGMLLPTRPGAVSNASETAPSPAGCRSR